MIDVEREQLIDFKQVAKHPAYRNPRNGKGAHIASVYRHVMRGARAMNGTRVKLEVVKTPSGLRTSTEAIARFISALTNPENTMRAPTSAARRRQIEQAEKELADAGML